MTFNGMNNLEDNISRIKEAVCAHELLEEFERLPQIMGSKLTFKEVGGYDIYNPTHPFEINGKTVIAARVEPSSYQAGVDKSQILFFEQTDIENTWVKLETPKILELEDPFVVKIGDEIVVGGVEVTIKKSKKKGAKDKTTWHTVFYKGKDLNSLKKFATGPKGMKDIRIIKLESGGIGVFTRPQGTGNPGKIGYLEIKALKQLDKKSLILQAPIIENQFAIGEWGGANQLHLLPDEKIGVIGHIACFDEKRNKHYYGMSFVYDTKTRQSTPLKIIATRANFPNGPSKKDDLKDVIFSGGIYEKDNKFYFYAGLSDKEAGVVEIGDPFVSHG